jgi:hypothetical protein
MRVERAREGLVALLFILSIGCSASSPVAASAPVLQAGGSSTIQGACFGYNGVNDTYIPATVKGLRIALVQPILTSTPYSQYATGSFYAFYAKENGVTTNVTTNLNFLSTDISSGYGFKGGWGLSDGFHQFFTSQTAKNCGLVIGSNVQILDDLNVSQGALFDPGGLVARFDVVVLPFTEYVTSQEYLAYESFVAGGGTLITMAHSLEYPVTYDATTHLETLVYAHGWAFNGKYAYPVPCNSSTFISTCPWAKNNTNWMGSNTCMSSCFHTYKFNGSRVNPGDTTRIGQALSREFGPMVFKSYASHEENRLTNFTGTSISSVFVNDSQNLIASYSHQYRKGSVVCMCVFGDDVIANDMSAQYFLMLGIVSSKLGPVYTHSTVTAMTSNTSSLGSPTSSASSGSSASPTASLGNTGPPPPQESNPIGTSTGLILVAGMSAIVVAAAAVILRQRRKSSN